VLPPVTKILLYLYLQVQELLSKDAPLSKACTILKDAADKLAADAAAAASKGDAATAVLQNEVTAANDTISRLTIANTELEKKAAANAQNTALLSKSLHTVLTELDETLPDEVSTCSCYMILYWYMHAVI
jgi:hypothetical protein